jgi:hypothetical protein
VKDLDGQVLPLLTKDLLLLLLEDLAGPVMRVYDVVAQLEFDELGLRALTMVLVVLLFDCLMWNWCCLLVLCAPRRNAFQVCR